MIKVVFSNAADTQGHVAVASLAVVLLASTLVLRGHRDHLASADFGAACGLAEDERCRRGAFRRQSSPDTPGRPQRPRAPGNGPRPA